MHRASPASVGPYFVEVANIDNKGVFLCWHRVPLSGLESHLKTSTIGATGIGKTQLGLSFSNQGRSQEGERGIFFDLTARGDSQNHSEYASRMFDWTLTEQPAGQKLIADSIWNREITRKDSLHLFQYQGRRVTASDMNSDQWRDFQRRAKKLQRQYNSIRRSQFAFEFVEGPVIQALMNGNWILLDEVNLAPSNVLQRLAIFLLCFAMLANSLLLSKKQDSLSKAVHEVSWKCLRSHGNSR